MKADELDRKFDKTMGKVEAMNTLLDVHDQAIRKSAEIMKSQKQSIDRNTDDIKTVIRKVGNLTIVGQTNTPKKPNGNGEES